MRNLLMILQFLALAATLSCEDLDFAESDEDGDKTESSGTIEVDDEQGVAGEVDFDAFVMGKEAGPLITGQIEVGLVSSNCSISNKDTLTTIYQLIKDYDGSGNTASQCVDGSNIYVALNDAQGMIENASTYCETITDQAVASNFDFGDDDISSTYNCYYEGSEQSGSNEYFRSYAIKEEGTTLIGNFGHYHTESGQTNPRSLQFSYDSSTEEVKVNQAYLVQYTSGETYNVRIHLTGDLNTNIFTTKLWKGGTNTSGEDTSSISIAGYGKAEGGYFLFKVCSSFGDPTACNSVDNKYYCFESDVSVSTISGWADSEDDGKTASEIASTNCSDYLDEVNALTLYGNADQASAESDFTGTGTGNYKLPVVTSSGE